MKRLTLLLLAIPLLIGCASSRQIIEEPWSPVDGLSQDEYDSLFIELTAELEAARDIIGCDTTGVER